MKFFLALIVLLAIPASAGAATLPATPSNFASVYAGAGSGDTVVLSAGSYGSFNGSAKSGMVTVDGSAGASFSGSDFSSVRNLTLKNVMYTGGVCITVPANTNMHLILDGLNMGSVGQSCREGRISIIGTGTQSIDGNGVQIKNSKFGPGGCSDGIQDSTNGTEVGPGNEFTGITQSCPASQAHADSIQPYASNFIHIHDNWFHGVEQGIMSPDGVSTGYLIENNSLQMNGNNYPCMHMGDTRNGTIRHNTCNTYIRVYGGNQNVNSQNMKVQDNASTVDNSGCTSCTIDHNQSVTFTGGTGRCGFATASPKGTASDGTDIGLNDCGSTPPPPPPPPPPTDHAPIAKFTASPEPSAVGQTVTFNASASTCEDTPCTYHWHDISGGGDWPLGPNGVTSTFAFQSTHSASAPVMAELVVTDADGDVAKVEHDHVVGSTTPPPPPPSTPETTLDRPPLHGSDWVYWTFSSTTANATFQCMINGGSWFPCQGATEYYQGLNPGTYSFGFRAVAPDGTVDPTPATDSWTITG